MTRLGRVDRVLKTVLYGLAGLALAVVLSLGAFAIAGRRLSHPAPTITISGPPPPSLSSPPSILPSSSPRPHDDDAKDPGADDHGGQGHDDGDEDD